jgi:hypothetical protein
VERSVPERGTISHDQRRCAMARILWMGPALIGFASELRRKAVIRHSALLKTAHP